ncbi:predicted protein [Phaeodactylum tricornutum CCAP 1055/1]|jgi:lipid-binding SYLF domain-containing protein|uniref:PX domain-containing protein n=2 Tax=Phaeodactylum tricornutum TaxID=2850 RepID=B7G886_PHATC|nr:predicted protein [Phaeodactylum tricornutum CCAP 1055/1]EEC45127.1 predicted protein [Phaeodactylum tricornutum CCAP 1055/1]|eukprot:XP_002183427.1 predicted protein [Phaeodactylum tricornutum CCAP 1055/1]
MSASLRNDAMRRAAQLRDDNEDDSFDNEDLGPAFSGQLPRSTNVIPPYQQSLAVTDCGRIRPPTSQQLHHSTAEGTMRAMAHPMAASEPSMNSTKSSNTADLASTARQEWRKHGTGRTQALEDKRYAHATQNPHHFVVRVVSAEKRSDLSNATFTTYVIRVIQNQQEILVEHRYSDFAKLHALCQTHNVATPGDACFPAKHWAGRIGNWTPSITWAPDKHDDLVSFRTIQLDIWLVHLLEQYNAETLPPILAQAVFEFLAAPDKLPCERENDTSASGDRWKWNNPVSFTLGSSIRQATRTVQYMCHGNMSETDQAIPLDLLQQAKGLVFMTVFKAGFVVSGRLGTGLVIARLEDSFSGEGGPAWSAPAAVGTVGMGWGALVGGDVTHYLIVLTTTKAVKDICGSNSIQLGAELGVAVGPVGRGATSHLQTGDWTLHPAYAYAHSQGLFVGLSLEGSVVRIRNDVNSKFYGQPVDAGLVMQQKGPKAAEPLYQALEEATQIPVRDGAFRPSDYFSPPPKGAPTPRTSNTSRTPFRPPIDGRYNNLCSTSTPTSTSFC